MLQDKNRIVLTMLYCSAVTLIGSVAGQSSVFAQNPSFAKQPVIVEYDVDTKWPKRPENISPTDSVAGVTIDGKDQVWLFTRGRDPVQVYQTDGTFVRSWGKGQFSKPHNLRIDHDGNIWTADIGSHVVQKFTPDGKLLLTLGTKGKRGEDETHFSMPTDMAITKSGDIFVTDGYGNRRVVHFDKHGKFIKTWGRYGSKPGQFILPHAIVEDSKGKLYVADRNSGRIQVFNQEGKFLDQWSGLLMPWGLSITDGDDLWICGSSPHWWVRNEKAPEFKDQLFMRFSTDGRLKQMWGIPLGKRNATHPGEAAGVHCIAQDSQGHLYVGDIYGKRAQKFRPVTQRQPKEAIPDKLPK